MTSKSEGSETTAKRRALLIAGPTASGKSAVALKLARLFDATIVNADSMQVYRDLRVLTARPSEAEEALARHTLFGVVDGAVNHSVGLWLSEAATAADRAFVDGRPAIFVGGTGLYFRALTEGLSDIPAVPSAIREKTRADAEGLSTPELHVKLAAIDPDTAARLRPSDRQRVLRALEVFAATGRSLVALQGARGAPALNAGEWAGLFLAPDRTALNAAIDGRFGAMLEAGALDEVGALAARNLNPALPVMRAHGAPHLIAHLAGRLTLEEAADRGKLDTRQYAKRQFTWARHQMAGFEWVAPNEAAKAGERALRVLVGA
jgi:tRNA dimethylallyltransferase